MEEKQADLRKCKVCSELVPRLFKEYYPNNKDRKFVDLNGSQWNGNVCPKCVRNKAKARYVKKGVADGQVSQ